jgi:hypothetical protein
VIGDIFSNKTKNGTRNNFRKLQSALADTEQNVSEAVDNADEHDDDIDNADVHNGDDFQILVNSLKTSNSANQFSVSSNNNNDGTTFSFPKKHEVNINKRKITNTLPHNSENTGLPNDSNNIKR